MRKEERAGKNRGKWMRGEGESKEDRKDGRKGREDRG